MSTHKYKCGHAFWEDDIVRTVNHDEDVCESCKAKNLRGRNLEIKPAEYQHLQVNLLSNEIKADVFRAGKLFPRMNSPHEASAVIREEFDEYWDEVKVHNTSKPDRDTRPRQRDELIQLAAMCMRAILDTIDGPKEKV